MLKESWRQLTAAFTLGTDKIGWKALSEDNSLFGPRMTGEFKVMCPLTLDIWPQQVWTAGWEFPGQDLTHCSHQKLFFDFPSYHATCTGGEEDVFFFFSFSRVFGEREHQVRSFLIWQIKTEGPASFKTSVQSLADYSLTQFIGSVQRWLAT